MTGGHVGEVRDVDWHRSDDGDSGFLMSVGQDQTTRVFAKNGRQVKKSFKKIEKNEKRNEKNEKKMNKK